VLFVRGLRLLIQQQKDVWQGDQTIHLRLNNSKVISLTRHELSLWLYSKDILIFLTIVLALVLTGNAEVFSSYETLSTRIFYLSVIASFYFTLLPFWVHLVWKLWTRVSSAPIWHPLAMIGWGLICAWISTLFSEFLGDWVPERQHFGALDYLRVVIILQFAENIAVFWLFPHFRAQQEKNRRHSADAFPSKTAPQIQIGGRKFDLSEILWVQSAGHHLHLRTFDDTHQVQARLKDFIALTSETDGIMPHRSYWVARDQILGMQGQNLKTRIGDSIPVSRGRQQLVAEWLRRHGIAH
jgi:hypothetical protein